MSDDPVKCAKCDQDVVLRRWFWVLVEEADARLITTCAAGGNHEPSKDDL